MIEELNYQYLQRDKVNVMVLPVTFFARRIALAFSAIFMGKYCFFQLLIQLALSSIRLGILIRFDFLDKTFSRRMEIMNELTLILVIYQLFCLTEFVPEAETRHFAIGYAYITVVLLNVLVHLIFLLRGSFKRFRKWCKKKCCSPSK